MKLLSISEDGSIRKPDEEDLHHTLLQRKPDELGAYESIRTYNGKSFRLKQHLERLQRSAELLGFPLPVSLEITEQWHEELVSSVWEELGKEQFLKIVATREKILQFSRELIIPEAFYTGVSVISYEVDRELPEAKQLMNHASHEAYQAAQNEGCYEAILINEEGFVTECAYANLFWVIDEQVFTSTKDALPGITQQAVMEVSREEIQVSQLHRDDLPRVQELFLTQTSKGIVPIIEIDGRPVGNGKVGERTFELLQLFGTLTSEECSI